MKRIFNQAVAMRLPKGTDVSDIRQKMKAMGYNCNGENTYNEPCFFVNNLDECFGDAGMVYHNRYNRCIIDHNPDLFLALSAMSEGSEFWPGEWVVLGSPEYMYKSDGMKGKDILLNGYGTSFRSHNYRKATRDEVIAHFAKPVVVEAEPEEVKQPPLGIMPRWRWLELRAMELQAAINRYMEAKVKVPEEWLDEKVDLCEELDKLGKIPTFTIDEACNVLAGHLNVPFVHITD